MLRATLLASLLLGACSLISDPDRFEREVDTVDAGPRPDVPGTPDAPSGVDAPGADVPIDPCGGCEPGLICVDTTCVPSCETDADCTDAGERCLGSVCRVCDADGDGYLRDDCADLADAPLDCDDEDVNRHPGLVRCDPAAAACPPDTTIGHEALDAVYAAASLRFGEVLGSRPGERPPPLALAVGREDDADVWTVAYTRMVDGVLRPQALQLAQDDTMRRGGLGAGEEALMSDRVSAADDVALFQGRRTEGVVASPSQVHFVRNLGAGWEDDVLIVGTEIRNGVALDEMARAFWIEDRDTFYSATVSTSSTNVVGFPVASGIDAAGGVVGARTTGSRLFLFEPMPTGRTASVMPPPGTSLAGEPRLVTVAEGAVIAVVPVDMGGVVRLFGVNVRVCLVSPASCRMVLLEGSEGPVRPYDIAFAPVGAEGLLFLASEESGQVRLRAYPTMPILFPAGDPPRPSTPLDAEGRLLFQDQPFRGNFDVLEAIELEASASGGTVTLGVAVLGSAGGDEATTGYAHVARLCDAEVP